MSGWGLLDAPPAGARWEFEPGEYRRRLLGARRRMAEAGIDCLFLTSEKNYHKEDILESPLTIEGGEIAVPRGPGLGVTLDRKRLDAWRL